MYDAIVVGARCAGASTAMLLARRGHRVLLVDRMTFPSDIPHGHMIHMGGPARLSRWGVLDRVLATGCPSVETMVLDLAGFPLVGRNLVVDGVAFGCGPRRKALDAVLIAAAIEAGAEFRDQFTVDDLHSEDGHVAGIVGHRSGSRSRVVDRARLTVGADGRNSRLAKTVGAPMYDAVPALTCWYFSYWSGDFEPEVAVRATDKNAIISFPTNDGLHAFFVGWPRAEFPVVRQDIGSRFTRALRVVPELGEQVAAGRQEERFYGTADLPNFGPGWALVGDAGCHKDPYLALGIADALRDAELLSDAAHEGLSGHLQMDQALAAYEQLRNAASKVDYQRNLEGARMTPMPEAARALFTALRTREEDTRQFFLVGQGLLPPERFFNPENLARVMAG